MQVAVIDAGYDDYSFEAGLFKTSGYQLAIFPEYKGSREAKLKLAAQASGILVRHTIINDEFLDACPQLQAIVRYGVGYDNIDIEACTQRRVKVANVQGYANHSVSEHALALLLGCSRGMWDTNKQVTDGFAAPPCNDVFELHDKILGIIGLGRIGSELSKKAHPLFKQIVASDPYKSQDYFSALHVKKVDLPELLETADVISLHCNLTAETTHILNDTTFAAMKKRPVIINSSRGETIDEKALLAALNNKQIHSAGIDVFEDEPTTSKQDALLNHNRTICTGHYAWYSNRSAIELQKRAAKNLLALLQNKIIEDSLN
jgi:D-3-phosphoglycerate dehydrogenase